MLGATQVGETESQHVMDTYGVASILWRLWKGRPTCRRHGLASAGDLALWEWTQDWRVQDLKVRDLKQHSHLHHNQILWQKQPKDKKEVQREHLWAIPKSRLFTQWHWLGKTTLKWEMFGSEWLCPPKFPCWDPNPQYDGTRRWGLWQVLRPWGWSLHEWEWCPYKWDSTEPLQRALLPCEDTARRSHLQKQNVGPHQTSNLRLPSLEVG